MQARLFYLVLLMYFLVGCKLMPRHSGTTMEEQHQATLRAMEFCRQKDMDLDSTKWSAVNPKEIPCTAPITPSK